jgi:hypothetical protein
MPRNMVSGKPSNQLAQGVDIPPTTRLAFSGYLNSTCGNTCCKGNQEYGHVVALQAYVLHFGSAYGLAVAYGGPVHESK